MSKSVIIIPSRLAATRFPNKPLVKINNKSLIVHVYEKALKSGVGEVYVATCDKKIALEIKKNGGKFIMTKSSHTNGTDRVFEASQKLNLRNIDYIINLQGDEPMINPIDIKNLNNFTKKKKLNIATLAYNINNLSDYKDKNIVKVRTKKKITNSILQEALEFSRSIHISNKQIIYQHYGIYIYKLTALKKFVRLNKTKNELKHKLEQLRVIDNKIKIHVLLAKKFSTGIDTKEDLHKYKKRINKLL